ncbi:MAG: GNAT family N-acetyltransferase [Chloroflexi bacterium]|nr:GNAT family N-acetyltransferase [Chloroflexota bacterium]
MSLSIQRQHVRQLVDDANPTDAPTAYYALFHDPARSALFTSVNSSGAAQGFVGRFQTGQDLFRPLVTMRCKTPEVAHELLQQALMPGRPYIFFVNINQLPIVGDSLKLDNQKIFSIYRLDVTRFNPIMNVLVQRKKAANGTPRSEIVAGNGQVVSVAGVNWQSPGFAEIYVNTDPAARERGYGKSVVAALIEQILREGRLPLYLVETRNDPSRELAEGLGFVDTGSRQVYADAVF